MERVTCGAVIILCMIIATAFSYRGQLEDETVDKNAEHPNKRMVQQLGSGYQFQASPVNINGKKGYGCRCDRYGRQVRVSYCLQLLEYVVNCIDF